METLSRAALVGVMIVVPTLAHREQSQQPIVAGIIARHIPLAAANVREGIDAECSVIQQDGAPEKADHEPRPSGNEDAERSEHDCWQDLQFVQPHQLKIRSKIGTLHQVSSVVLSIENPADMTVHQALLPG